MNARWNAQWINVWLSTLEGAVIFGGMKGFWYSFALLWTVVFHYTFEQWNLSEKKKPYSHPPHLAFEYARIGIPGYGLDSYLNIDPCL